MMDATSTLTCFGPHEAAGFHNGREGTHFLKPVHCFFIQNSACLKPDFIYFKEIFKVG